MSTNKLLKNTFSIFKVVSCAFLGTMIQYNYIKVKRKKIMRTNEEIVKILIDERDKQNVSISELARRVDMAKSAVSRYFNFSREFPLNRADDFAKALNISAEYLLGLELKGEHISETKEKIGAIISQLEQPRQEKVLQFAESELKEQNKPKEKIISINKNKMTLEELAEKLKNGAANDGKPLPHDQALYFAQLMIDDENGDDD